MGLPLGLLLGLALKPLPDPYYCRDPATGAYDTKRVCNKSAADDGYMLCHCRLSRLRPSDPRWLQDAWAHHQ